jgi:hypothetical protein
MHGRERAHHERDNNRLVRPFDWGLSFISDHVNGDDPREVLRNYSAKAMAQSEDFYALPAIPDFQLQGDQLTWTSAIHTPSPENNLARARFSQLSPRRRGNRALPSSCCRSGTLNQIVTLKPARYLTSSACQRCV